MSGLLIVGAGGHGKVVADTALETGCWQEIAFLDARYPELQHNDVAPVIGTEGDAGRVRDRFPELVVAIGNSSLRISLLEKFRELGFRLADVIHPRAFVSRDVVLGGGCVVFAQAAINRSARLGLGCIVNTGATVDHDCLLGNGVHCCPGSHLGGGVRIGDFSWVGIGASVIQQISIGARVTLGAGSAVISDIPDHATAVGVPARVVTTK